MGVAGLLLAITQVQIPELRAGAVKARSRARAHAVGAQRRDLDGAEHSSILGRVMAGGVWRTKRG